MMGMLLLSTCFSVAQNKTQSTTNTETSKVQKKSTQQLFKETYRNQNRRDEPVFQAWVTDPDPTGTNVRQIPNGVVMRILMPNEHSYMVARRGNGEAVTARRPVGAGGGTTTGTPG